MVEGETTSILTAQIILTVTDLCGVEWIQSGRRLRVRRENSTSVEQRQNGLEPTAEAEIERFEVMFATYIHILECRLQQQ